MVVFKFLSYIILVYFIMFVVSSAVRKLNLTKGVLWIFLRLLHDQGIRSYHLAGTTTVIFLGLYVYARKSDKKKIFELDALKFGMEH